LEIRFQMRDHIKNLTGVLIQRWHYWGYQLTLKTKPNVFLFRKAESAECNLPEATAVLEQP
jgi:hypothetical protein